MPSVIVKSDVPSISALAEPDAIWSGLTLYTEPSVTSSKIKKSLEVSTVMPVPSVNLDGSTTSVASPVRTPPSKPEVADVTIPVISPSAVPFTQAEPLYFSTSPLAGVPIVTSSRFPKSIVTSAEPLNA